MRRLRPIIILCTSLAAASARADVASSLELGTARVDAGDFAGAIAPLAEAHAEAPDDVDAALLLGIAYYRIGRGDAARPLLEQAEASRDASVQASARVFLGLIADAEGDSARARAYYQAVARSASELSPVGRRLLDQTGAERWSIVGILRPELDSNVALQPATATPGSATTYGDADAALIVAATGRPIASLPLVLDDTLIYRKQAQLVAYDLVADTLGATYTVANRDNRAGIAYHFEASTLGGARYELGHIADASFRHALGNVWLGVRYTFAARDYAPMDFAGYTGTSHTGVAELARGPLEAGYVIARELTADPSLTATAQGGRATLHARPWASGELRATALGLRRAFDEGRRDLQLRGDLSLYQHLSSSVGLVIGGTYTRNGSSDPGFDYAKWTLFAGLALGASS